MKTYTELLKECETNVDELFPWDLDEKLNGDESLFLLDVREPDEFNSMHIKGSVNAPRGVLETSCEWGFDETIPELVQARDKTVIVICRSGNRSLLAARTMQIMGYEKAISLKTGLRGWNDYELSLQDINGETVDEDFADEFFSSKVSKEQMPPK